MGYFFLILLLLFKNTEAQFSGHGNLCSNLSPLPCCSNGYPLQLRCPMQRCPPGYSCHTHILQRWSVCCRSALIVNQAIVPRQIGQICTTQNNLPCCQTGRPFPGIMNCQLQRCPNGYFCSTHMAGRWAICCPVSQQSPRTVLTINQTPIGTGQTPSSSSSGTAAVPSLPSIPQEAQILGIAPPECNSFSRDACCPGGLSPLQGSNCRFQKCPDGFTCNVHSADRWAVCCPERKCTRRSDVACCTSGELLNIQCRVQACPAGYTCNTHVNNRWSVCCSDTSVSVCTSQSKAPCCPRGRPTQRAQCQTRGCPERYTCNQHSGGRWAVCCPQDLPQPRCTNRNQLPCCPQGNPLRIRCPFQSCPTGYSCNTHYNNEWSVCCAHVDDPSQPPTQSTPTCNRQSQKPCCATGLPDTGIPNCRVQSCRVGHTCHINIIGLWAVCCRNG